MTPDGSDLGKPLELEPGVTSFLTRLEGSSEEEGPPPEPPVGELREWVTWKAEATKTPDWWRQLLALVGVPDCKKLARQIWVSFSHPRRAKEMKEMKYHCHAPPAPLCLLQDHFLPPPITIFACRDIWEVWREKTIVYACAIQYWVEKSNLPAGGQPCWLAESAKELREEMRCYLFFTDYNVFEGVTPPEGTPTDQVEESQPPSETANTVIAPKESTAKETTQELVKERECPKFPRWEKVLHPCWPVAVVGQPPHPSRTLEETYPLTATHDWPLRAVPTKTSLSCTRIRDNPSMGTYSQFPRCDYLLEKPITWGGSQSPPLWVVMGMMAALGMVTMSASCVVWDEVTGAIYLDTVTTSVGRVALSVPEDGNTMPGPEIEDIMDLI